MFAPLHQNLTVAVLMRKVCYALLPATAVLVWQFGLGVVVNLIIAATIAIVGEALLLRLRHSAVRPFVCDNSALLTAWLIALAVPPCVPWWTIAIASGGAIIIGKQLYGGLGNNIFNPAMVGYAIVIVAFPLFIANWQNIDPAMRFDWPATLRCIVGERHPDVISGATPLSAARFQLAITADTTKSQWLFPNLAFLLGGIWLLQQRIIQWYLPVGFLFALGAGSMLLHLVDTDYPTPIFHWLNGATMIGAFFIITDPVTAPKAKSAMIIFGAGVGFLLLIFRSYGNAIDGLAFAVLIMNMLTPLLNRYSKP